MFVLTRFIEKQIDKIDKLTYWLNKLSRLAQSCLILYKLYIQSFPHERLKRNILRLKVSTFKG